MTKKVFWQDPYLTQLDTRVTRVGGNDVTVAELIFYAAEERRYWEVVGFVRVPCGGAHLQRTGEVGKILLKRDNIGKGKERIEVYVLP